MSQPKQLTATAAMRTAINGLITCLTVLYPFAVVFGARYLEPRQIAGALLVLLAIRLVAGHSENPWSRPLLLAGMAYCGFAVWSNQPLALKFYPVVVNVALLLVFSASLWSPQSLIERLARLQQPNLPPEGVIYTRRVTQIWCGFFVVNGGIALTTALWASAEVWSWYNGCIAYLLIGILLGGEYLVRMKTQRYC